MPVEGHSHTRVVCARRVTVCALKVIERGTAILRGGLGCCGHLLVHRCHLQSVKRGATSRPQGSPVRFDVARHLTGSSPRSLDLLLFQEERIGVAPQCLRRWGSGRLMKSWSSR
jgi:hypothetical protein